MLEADIIMRGHVPKEPIMAHPPETDSDITLKDWLQGVKSHNKGMKLDFKRCVLEVHYHNSLVGPWNKKSQFLFKFREQFSSM